MKDIFIKTKLDESLLTDESLINHYRKHLNSGKCLIIKNFINKDYVEEILNYLEVIGKSSFPNYYPIEKGTPNFHRLNKNDSRAHVKGTFHQFSFFPWNQDLLDLFNKFERVFRLKNILSEIPEKKFLGIEPEDDCTSRISFQFYPAGEGYLSEHKDPINHHQIAVPVLLLSKKGKDFKTGGGYYKLDNEKISTDDYMDVGDIVFFKADIKHGVDLIDKGFKENWLEFKGRWIAIFAINKLASNKVIQNATQTGD